MSFSSGTFSINTAGQPVVTGTVISSTAFNALTADLATGLSTCILKDGTQTLTANIPMGNFKLTGLAAGTAAGNSLRYEQVFTSGTVTLLGNLSVPGTALVTGVATLTAQPILSSLTASRGVLTDGSKGLISADAPLTNSLSGDVNLDNTANFIDGPTVAQGTSGTWFVSGSVVVRDNAGAASIQAKLHDGTTVIASGSTTTSGINVADTIALSGYITSPAGNLRISCKDSTSTSGKISFNQSGSSKDATVTAIRIA